MIWIFPTRMRDSTLLHVAPEDDVFFSLPNPFRHQVSFLAPPFAIISAFFSFKNSSVYILDLKKSFSIFPLSSKRTSS